MAFKYKNTHLGPSLNGKKKLCWKTQTFPPISAESPHLSLYLYCFSWIIAHNSVYKSFICHKSLYDSLCFATFLPIKQIGGIKVVQTETGDAVVPPTHRICRTWTSLFLLDETGAVAAYLRLSVGLFFFLSRLCRHQHSSALFPPILSLQNYLCRLVKLQWRWCRAAPRDTGDTSPLMNGALLLSNGSLRRKNESILYLVFLRLLGFLYFT